MLARIELVMARVEAAMVGVYDGNLVAMCSMEWGEKMSAAGDIYRTCWPGLARTGDGRNGGRGSDVRLGRVCVRVG